MACKECRQRKAKVSITRAELTRPRAWPANVYRRHYNPYLPFSFSNECILTKASATANVLAAKHVWTTAGRANTPTSPDSRLSPPSSGSSKACKLKGQTNRIYCAFCALLQKQMRSKRCYSCAQAMTSRLPSTELEILRENQATLRRQPALLFRLTNRLQESLICRPPARRMSLQCMPLRYTL